MITALSFLAGFAACMAVLFLKRRVALRRADQRDAARRDAALARARGFIWFPPRPRSRFLLPRGFADAELLRALVEFAAFLALMVAMAFAFLGAEPPQW